MSQRILVLRLSSLGDIILTTPVFRLLKRKFPSAQIDVVVKKEYAELFRHNPHIHTIYSLNTSEGKKKLIELWDELLHNEYDIVIDLHNSLRTRVLRLFQAKKRFIIKKEIIKRFLLVQFKINHFKEIVTIPEKYIRTLQPLGIENDDEGLEIFFSDEIRERVGEKFLNAALLKTKQFFAIAPTARHCTKRWLSERYIELAISLAKKHNAAIIVFGAENEKEYCESVTNAINAATPSTAVNVAGKLSLLETAALLERCNLVVTNDSALQHLAAAVKKNVVSIFGSTVEEFGFFPYRTNFRVVQNRGLHCRPCSHIGLSECPKGHFRCMNEISVPMVEEAVAAVLGH